MTVQRKKQIGLAIFILALIFICGVGWLVGRPMVRFVSDPEQFRLWVEGHGIWSRLIFVGMLIFQVVVALIPGEPMEIGAGYAFGAVEGTLLCVAGIIVGSILIFQLVRRFGIQFVELFFSVDKIRSLKFLQNERRLNTVAFIIFMIPGTPKDLLSYFVGLTNMKLSTWVFITMVARLPSIVTSTIGGNALGSENYGTAAIVLAVTAGLSVAGWLLYNLWSRKRQQKKDKE